MSRTRRLTFTLQARSSETLARAGVLDTPRGRIRTPIFMPVGTLGTVKTLSPDELRDDVGAEIILANTYHLYLRPGEATLQRVGGLHRFMGWDRPLLTDSGGYQFFSLRELAKFDDDGVSFRSHLDGSRHRFTPERAVEVQAAIGSDIMMALDHCPPLPSPAKDIEAAMRRTTAWARRCLDASHDVPGALFCIVQGGTDVALRRAHVEELAAMPFEGLALGGLAVGETPQEMYDTIEAVTPAMPRDRPRYLMGVGRPEDLVEAIARGIDMFDCVMPTRNARNAQVFTRAGKLNLRNARFATDDRPLDDACGCGACTTFSRSYVHHLVRAGEVLGIRLTTLHNLRYYLDLVREARLAIEEDRFIAWRAATRAGWSGADKGVDR